MAANSYRSDTVRPKSAASLHDQSVFMMLPSVQLFSEDALLIDDDELEENGMPKCWVSVQSPYVRRMKQVHQQKTKALADTYTTASRKLNSQVINMSLQPLRSSRVHDKEIVQDSGRVTRVSSARPSSSVSTRPSDNSFPARSFISTESLRSSRASSAKSVSVNVPPAFWEEFTEDFKYYKRQMARKAPEIKLTVAKKHLERRAGEPTETRPQLGPSLVQRLHGTTTERPRTAKRVQFNGQQIPKSPCESDALPADPAEPIPASDSAEKLTPRPVPTVSLAFRNLIDDFVLPPTQRDTRPRSAVSTSSLSSRGSYGPGQEFGSGSIISANPTALVSLNGTIRVTRNPPMSVETAHVKFSRIYKNAGVSGDVLSTNSVGPVITSARPAGEPSVYHAPVAISRPMSASSTCSRVSVTAVSNEAHAGLKLENVNFNGLHVDGHHSLQRPYSMRYSRPPPPRWRPRSAVLKQNIEYVHFCKSARREDLIDCAVD